MVRMEAKMTAHRIFLIHAVPVAMDPVRAAFATDWPEAEIVNLLDDSLSTDRARDNDLAPSMFDRIQMLTTYALEAKADGILFTCSAFGAAIMRAAQSSPVPVLTPNEAMFEKALECGSRIGMLATFAPSVAGMESEFHAAAMTRGQKAQIETELEPEAMVALRSGDAARHNELLAARATALKGCDAIMLAQFSTSRAARAVAEAVSKPVLTSPGAAVAKLRAILRGGLKYSKEV